MPATPDASIAAAEREISNQSGVAEAQWESASPHAMELGDGSAAAASHLGCRGFGVELAEVGLQFQKLRVVLRAGRARVGSGGPAGLGPLTQLGAEPGKLVALTCENTTHNATSYAHTYTSEGRRPTLFRVHSASSLT